MLKPSVITVVSFQSILLQTFDETQFYKDAALLSQLDLTIHPIYCHYCALG